MAIDCRRWCGDVHLVMPSITLNAHASRATDDASFGKCTKLDPREKTVFPFMRLPPELRQVVYELILQPKNLEVQSTQGISRNGIPAPGPFYRAASRDLAEEAFDEHATALLRSCKQLHDEAKPFLYRPKQLTFLPLWVPPTVMTPSPYCKFDPMALSTIFHLDTLNIQLHLRAGPFSARALAHSKGLTAGLEESLLVRRVIVTIYVQSLEFDLSARSIRKDRVRRDAIIADQIAVIAVWRDALARAHLAEGAEIRYAATGHRKVIWKKARDAEWVVEEEGERFDGGWYPAGVTRSVQKRCYRTLIPAAMQIFDQPSTSLAAL